MALLKPKIYYESSPRFERCLREWEHFFRSNGVKYRTDRAFGKGVLGDENISIIFGSWKDRKSKHHRIKRAVVASGKPFIVIETSLLGREKVTHYFDEPWFRIGVNGYLADSGLFNNDGVGIDRWKKIQDERNIDLHPWNPTGKYILVVLQLPGDASLRGASIEKWALKICTSIRQVTDFPIVIRRPQLEVTFSEAILEECTHMVNVSIEPGSRENLFSSIDNCIFGCTFSSGMGIDLMLRGKPVIADDPGSFVYPIRTEIHHALEGAFNMPNRIPLLSKIAYCQWHLSEIQTGAVWKHLLPVLTACNYDQPWSLSTDRSTNN